MENNDNNEPKVNKYRGRYKEKAKLRYQQNREAVIEKNKAIYKNNKETILCKKKDYYQSNKDVFKLSRQLAKEMIEQNKIKV
jgi:5-methylcytosine-specific restriction endonuclease McrA